MRRILLVSLGVLISLTVLAKGDTPSTVTLPIQTYEEFLKLRERPAVTSLKEIVLTGALRDGKLVMEISGESSRNGIASQFFQPGGTGRLANCNGNALIYWGDSGYNLLPKGDQVQVRCDFRFPEQEALNLTFGSSVLHVTSRLNDAEVNFSPASDGTTRVALNKKISRPVVATQGKVTVLPRYNVTVLADETRFRYQLHFENPNPRARNFEVPLRNGERISEVQTSAPNEWGEKAITLTLPQGSSVVTVTGQLPQPSFRPLFDMEEQYLVLEFHPLVALKLLEAPPRIDLAQTGIRSSYPSAMAFLIGKGKSLSWESKIREVFASESFVITSANYTVYLPQRGEPLVDATWQVRNQGKPNLQFELPGRALFASVDGVPQVLAKTDKNELYLPLRTGETLLRIQYEAGKKLPRVGGLWKVPLAKPPADLPLANVSVNLDSHHAVGALNLLLDTRIPWFDGWRLIWALAVAFAWFLALQAIPIPRSKAILSASSVVVLGSLCGGLTCLAALLMLSAIIVRNRRRILDWFRRSLKTMGVWQKLLVSGLAAVLGLIFLATLATRPVLRGRSSPSGEYNVAQSAVRAYGKMEALRRDEPASAPTDLAKENLNESQDAYLGLPVEREIPLGKRQFWLTESSVPQRLPLPLRIIVVGSTASSLLLLLLLGAWLGPIVPVWGRLKTLLRNPSRP